MKEALFGTYIREAMSNGKKHENLLSTFGTWGVSQDGLLSQLIDRRNTNHDLAAIIKRDHFGILELLL